MILKNAIIYLIRKSGKKIQSENQEQHFIININKTVKINASDEKGTLSFIESHEIIR